MRKLLCLSAFILLMAICIGTASAGSWELYVRGKIFADMKVSNHHFYVPVQPFFNAIKFCYAQDGEGKVFVTRDLQTRQGLRIKGGVCTFVFEGKSFNLPITHFDNAAYMDLESAVSKFGLEMTKTPQTQIIDIVDPVQRVKHQQEIEKRDAYEKRMSAKPEDEAGQAGNGNYDPKEPVKLVGDVDGFIDQSQTTWEARWKATVKNHADQPVKNVRIVLNIVDGNNETIDKQVKVVGNMNPGDTQTAEFYWQDTLKIMATPKIEIQNDPLPVTAAPEK
ncbi:MAG: FxLYD domain-containing protein [bacterium]|nr:FxLYD domain-containing protein [bacterium]